MAVLDPQLVLAENSEFTNAKKFDLSQYAKEKETDGTEVITVACSELAEFLFYSIEYTLINRNDYRHLFDHGAATEVLHYFQNKLQYSTSEETANCVLKYQSDRQNWVLEGTAPREFEAQVPFFTVLAGYIRSQDSANIEYTVTQLTQMSDDPTYRTSLAIALLMNKHNYKHFKVFDVLHNKDFKDRVEKDVDYIARFTKDKDYRPHHFFTLNFTKLVRDRLGYMEKNRLKGFLFHNYRRKLQYFPKVVFSGAEGGNRITATTITAYRDFYGIEGQGDVGVITDIIDYNRGR